MHNFATWDEAYQFEGIHCRIAIDSPTDDIVIVRISGSDVGEFGQAPLNRLKNYLSDDQQVELFIDARYAKAASIEVSNEWALWLGAHRSRIKVINMLTGSKFVEVTAGFVRMFSSLENNMRIYTDAKSFDEALTTSLLKAFPTLSSVGRNSNEINQSLGNVIKVLRIVRNMSQENLAEICDLDKSFISDVEKGKQPLEFEMIIRLADALSIKPSKLISLFEGVGGAG
ncbi:MAG: helix-turn-helix transcriptional regulator [Balneolales bacterium]